MSEVLLCNRPLNARQLSSRCGFGVDQLTACGCTKPTHISPHTPYLIGGDAADASILTMLSVPPVARGLTELSMNLGSDSLLPLARIRDDLQEAGVGLLGETAQHASKRGSEFVRAVRNYQTALLEYRKAIVANASNKASARQAAQRAFDEMQRQFSVAAGVSFAANKWAQGNAGGLYDSIIAGATFR